MIPVSTLSMPQRGDIYFNRKLIFRDLAVYGFTQTLDIADGKQAPDGRIRWVVVAVAFHGGHVVRAQHTLEADIVVSLHAGEHIGLALIVEGLDELLRCAAHVAEMSKEDFVLLAKFSDNAG